MMGLKPEFRQSMEQFQKDAAAQGIQTRAVSGYRSTDLQSKLYANYQAKQNGQPLPYPEEGSGGIAAPPGQSYHNYGEASDVSSRRAAGRIRYASTSSSNNTRVGYQVGGLLRRLRSLRAEPLP